MKTGPLLGSAVTRRRRLCPAATSRRRQTSISDPWHTSSSFSLSLSPKVMSKHLRHRGDAATCPEARLVVMQHLDDIFFTLSGDTRDGLAAGEVISVT